MANKKILSEELNSKVIEKVIGEQVATFNRRNLKTRSIDAVNIENAILSVDGILDDIFLNSEYINEGINEFHSKHYNTLDYQGRVQLFANLSLCLNQVFGDDIIKNGVKVIADNVGGENIFISDGELYMAKDLFEHKNSGLINLTNVVYEFRKYLIIELTQTALASGIVPSDLNGLARVYYENVAESILEGSWKNFKSKEDKDYYYQPIILDSTKKSTQYGFEYMKRLYKSYHKVDSEMSYLTNNAMSFYDLKKQLQENRSRIVKENRENVKKYDVDLDNYERYLDTTLLDFSKFSDDEFFELFNISYYLALNEDYDDKLTTRLENLSNELVVRTFRDFDTSKIDLPTYKLQYDRDNNTMMLVTQWGDEISQESVEDSSHIFTNVVSDIATIARQHCLVKFNNEQEKQDWIDMDRWYQLKSENLTKQDIKVINDGLNIILTKVSELLNDLCSKIDCAISRSSFTPHGKSMIRSDDREATYDYYEFKNGLSKEEVRANLMKYVRDDLKRLESKGGR